ncbi:hypothetical protein Vafri_9217 [Volvox africanus]|uniref:RecF/RecN/SMC N-terminal domain-containing protein n=1 Tax=Volvox africanus TaxID=51714 RepID=A0A8J4B880_9CHLO|nr:hypothetical protein Vafri_9217 [Volvox africanus]
MLRCNGGGGGDGGDGGSTTDGRHVRQTERESMAAEVAALRARAAQLESVRQRAQDVVEDAETAAEAAEARVAGLTTEAEAESRVMEGKKLVQDLEDRLQDVKAAVEAAARRQQELEIRIAANKDRTEELQRKLHNCRTAQRSRLNEVTNLQATLKRIVKERDSVRREYGGGTAPGGGRTCTRTCVDAGDGGSGKGTDGCADQVAAAAATATATATAVEGKEQLQQQKQQQREERQEMKDTKEKGGDGEEDVATSEKQANALRARLRSLQSEHARLEGSQVLPAQLLQFQERVSAVAILRERATNLASAADMLQMTIEQSEDQVLAANTAVFNAVRRRFVTLCGRLLPTLDLDLTASYGCASRGVAVRFRRCGGSGGSGSDAANGDDGSGGYGEGSWSDELGQLSGGQRTLVSVAMLLGLALAIGGGGGGGLFLLDEVDAALDEHNQAAVAALLRYLAHRGRGCQVLAVTHNAAFQAACEGFVRVTRGSAGTQVEATGLAATSSEAQPPLQLRAADADPRVGGDAGTPHDGGAGGNGRDGGTAAGGCHGTSSSGLVLITAKRARTAGTRRM